MAGLPVKEYLWPATGKPMPMFAVKFYSDRGLRYKNLLEPKCWDCGNETSEATGLHPAIGLKYFPMCRHCSDMAFVRAMKRCDDAMATHEKQARLPSAQENLQAYMTMLRSPTTDQEARAVLAELIADSITEIKRMKEKLGAA